MNRKTIIGIFVVVVVVIVCYLFFSRNVNAPSEKPAPINDADLPDRSGN